MGRDHAEHNRDCCNSLHSVGKFNDWVVTTTFYAALHFVSNEIFPLSVKGKRYVDLDDYYRQLPNPKKSKHLELNELVRRNISLVKGQYKWLYDNCMSARYKNSV